MSTTIREILNDVWNAGVAAANGKIDDSELDSALTSIAQILEDAKPRAREYGGDLRHGNSRAHSDGFKTAIDEYESNLKKGLGL